MDFWRFSINGVADPKPDSKVGKSESVNEFFKFCALCHKMLVEQENGVPWYSSQSPDEIALVKAASEKGYVLNKVTKDKYFITAHGKEEVY
jgi:magnesium-transporting ATPase (P-type)